MDLTALRADVSGTVLSAEDAAWDDARLSHAGLGRPDTIVRVASVDDVVAAVRFATVSRRSVVVRSGGHSAWCTLDDGILIDLSALADVVVDDTEQGGPIVRIGGGAHWGAVARALAPHGLGLSSGDTASVGVGGLTLGGGIGWMVRAWGLAVDQLVGAQVVTARGDVVETSAEAHPDLFWALRGGGGNFGVVTRFDFRAHPLPGVAVVELGITGDARVVLRALRDVLAAAPPELTVTYMDVPEIDPNAPAGASVTAVWAGPDPAALEGVLAPVIALGEVVVREVAVRDYPDILLDHPLPDPEAPVPGFLGGNTLAVTLDDVLIDDVVAFRESNEASVVFLRSLGGAYGEVAPDTTPFPARDATWFVMAGAFDLPGLVTDADRARISGEWEAIERRGAGVYGNFTTTTDAAYVDGMFAPATRARLAAVKRAWDPTNVFSRNHNIAPV